jgi:hypothetical protein
MAAVAVKGERMRKDSEPTERRFPEEGNNKKGIEKSTSKGLRAKNSETMTQFKWRK